MLVDRHERLRLGWMHAMRRVHQTFSETPHSSSYIFLLVSVSCVCHQKTDFEKKESPTR